MGGTVGHCYCGTAGSNEEAAAAMSPITHIIIPIELYADKNLCEIKRAILALTLAFGKAGLTMSDSKLAAMFGKTRQWINQLISKLCRDGYIKITRPGSKYRGIYCTLKLTGLTQTSQEKSTGMENESSVVDRNKSSKVDRNQNESSKVDRNESNIDSTVKSQLTHKEEEEEAPLTGEALVEYWNSKGNLPTIRKFTHQRQLKLKARMKERLFTENWKGIIDRVSASPFCTGQKGRGWKADVGWILDNDTNYVKVLEGKYEDSIPQSGERDYSAALGKLTAPLSPEQEAELVKDGLI